MSLPIGLPIEAALFSPSGDLLGSGPLKAALEPPEVLGMHR